ncbi:YfbU family protein [Vibrio hepatarius]|uniref:YfbU family protein n=1 Tax=Vibrio hepatarius TaxID=171383 RepID=UPI00142E5CDC|nr:YfbU family protein [Vibrio hepatarius]NIY83039.1 hypothetical protein [Vibrio hepatarius]
MVLTEGEKLNALMLADLYENLEVKGDIDPSFIKTAIYNNHCWSISFRYPSIFSKSRELPEKVNDVFEILEMWQFIERHCLLLNEEEKTRLTRAIKPLRSNPKFEGFDGNNETEYMEITQCIVEELELFQEFKGRSFNSYAPSIDGYKRMLVVYEKIKQASLYGNQIGVEEIARVLHEMLYLKQIY